MSAEYDIDRLLEILEGDRELLEKMERLEIIQSQEGRYTDSACERARVVRTLVRELEVDWAGVEIIIRLREELIETRQRLAEALDALRDFDREQR